MNLGLIAIWIVALLALGLIGNYVLDRFIFGRTGVRGYWPRALVMAVLLSGGVVLILWKAF